MYRQFDNDPRADDEAMEIERLDADAEMAALNRAGDAAAAAERRGVCTHGSAAGYLATPAYPEQAGLRPGQLRCTKGTGGCTRVFDSEEEWIGAMRAATRR